MEEDDVLRNADKVVREARKIIAETEKVLKRTADYFKEQGIDPEQLKQHLAKNVSPTILREIDMMAEQTLREAKEDADRAIAESLAPASPTRARRFRTHI
jgi:uncharacterized protein YaaN involved in tellurite resistance